MTSEPSPADAPDAGTHAPPTRILVGYDGSPAAATAIEVGALLFPKAHALITLLWAPPFGKNPSRHQLALQARSTNELIELIEREAEQEAQRLVAVGVAIARSVHWEAEPLALRTYAGEGLRLAALAEERRPDLVLVGSRGLSGTSALLGSVSDLVVHHSPQPVLVVPHPLLTAEHTAAAEGPVLVGWDDSEGARRALTTAATLLPGRELIVASVDRGNDPGRAASLVDPQRITFLELDCPPGVRGPGRAVADALADCARERGAALIVMGSQGRSAIQRILLGSAVMATLHHAQFPVMVVPSRE